MKSKYISQRQHSPTTTSRPITSKQIFHRVLWLMFYRASKKDLHLDSAEQRWRLLLWALLVSTLWNAAGHDWGIFAPILLIVFLIKVILTCTTRNGRRINGCWVFPACLAVLCAITVLTTSSPYFTFAHLMQKMAVKEYKLWCHWCPDTLVTIASVIVITCAVQGIPSRSLLSGLACQSNLKRNWTPLRKH